MKYKHGIVIIKLLFTRGIDNHWSATFAHQRRNFDIILGKEPRNSSTILELVQEFQTFLRLKWKWYGAFRQFYSMLNPHLLHFVNASVLCHEHAYMSLSECTVKILLHDAL